MKSRLFILIILIQVFTSVPLYSQSPILDTEVRFTGQSATIKQLLYTMEKMGDFTFSYGKEVPVDRTVKISTNKQSIRKHLDDMFSGDSLAYIEKVNKILIVPILTIQKRKNPEQTVRGKVVDLVTKLPLIGVNIILGSEGPVKGTISDEEGYFRFEKVPVGRHELNCSSIGYKPIDIPGLVVLSGKEKVLFIEMEESVFQLAEVRINSLSDRSKPINSLAVVSGRSFSAYEVENYPASLSDISRAAVSFPGVVSTNDGQNHMVIRGNSPKGLQWRMEGIEIPNLNHFSDIGASGGGVNVVSSNMLANSDFLTSAFPAEYGNALSGVVDLRLRTGNNEKHEQTFQLGMIGTEIMVEGPISRTTNTTYIAQYRYSTLRILEKLSPLMESVPSFQDLSFKIYHPSKKMGVFTLFGIGGLSFETGSSGYEYGSDMATVGLSNSYTINGKTHLRSVMAVSGRSYSWYEESNIGSPESPIDYIWDSRIFDYTVKGSLILDQKINARHTLKAGIIYEMEWDDSFMGWHSDTLQKEHTYVNSTEHAGTLQTFTNWQYHIGNALTLNTGMHFIQFYLNNNFSVEPRLGLQWNVSSRHTLSAGFGIHSRKESMTLYTGLRDLPDGSMASLNRDLELSKARHYVLGYNFRITPLLQFKAELYYQDLFDIPAYPFPPYFSTQNYDFGFEGNVLTNYGTGYNTGIELALEKYMSNGFHFMWNGTLYDSKYVNKPGKKLNTKYNGKYATNGVIGKEFKLGKGHQHTLGLSSRYILAGGMRQLPIEIEASGENGYTVRYWDDGFTEQVSDYFRIDLLLKFRRNRPKYTGEWSLDLLNLLNRQNVLNQYWDKSINDLENTYQNPFIFIITYRIQF